MDPNAPPSKFKTPYVNAQYIVPALLLLFLILAFTKFSDTTFYFLKWESLSAFFMKLPMYTFVIGFFVIAFLSFKHKFSLIPVLGLLCCFYMLSQLGYKNWLYFTVWLVVGLVIYFLYGYHHSKLSKKSLN
jgi:hypothetical protein